MKRNPTDGSTVNQGRLASNEKMNRARKKVDRGPVDKWAPIERVQRLCNLTIDFIEVPMADREVSQADIFATIEWQPDIATPKRLKSRFSTLPPASADVARMCGTPLLTPEQEIRFFRVMNYLKLRAAELRGSLRPERPTPFALVEEIEMLLARADIVRNHILRANLRLVISIAKKFVNAANTFEDLVSEGNLSLLRAAEKYNFALGNRFSTYATRAIRNNLFHYVTDGHRRRQRFHYTEEESLRSAEDTRANERVSLNAFETNRGAVQRLLELLDPQKRAILESRFGLQNDGKGRTLKTLAGELGVSRERVRQIEARALRELRLVAVEEQIAFSEDLL